METHMFQVGPGQEWLNHRYWHLRSTSSYIDQGTSRMTVGIHWINAFRQCMAQGLTIHSMTFEPTTCPFFVLIFGKVSSPVIICKSIISVTTPCWLLAHVAIVCELRCSDSTTWSFSMLHPSGFKELVWWNAIAKSISVVNYMRSIEELLSNFTW